MIYARWGQAVLRLIPKIEATVIPMPERVRGFALGPPDRRGLIAVALERGAMLLWQNGTTLPFANDLSEPRVAFARNGLLVAADRQAGRVYRVSETTLRQVADFPGLGPDAIALTATSQLDQFAAADAGGRVTVYQLPSGS